MIFGENLPLILAAVVAGLALAQAIHPFGLRVPPALSIVVAALLCLRWAMRHQKRVWREKLKDVPERPLGIDE